MQVEKILNKDSIELPKADRVEEQRENIQQLGNNEKPQQVNCIEEGIQ